MKEFFEQRGFTNSGDCTSPLDRATHEAIHKWMEAGAWNDVMKNRVLPEESRIGRLLTKRESLSSGAPMRREAGLGDVKIIPYGES